MLEQEIKLVANSQDVLNAVLSSELIQPFILQKIKPARFISRYHDTQNRVFTRSFCSLRSRLEGSKMFATFKEKGTIVDGLSQHHELEAEIDDWLKIPDMLPESPLKNRVLQIVSADDLLETMVTVEMTRTILELKVANTEIECAADCGHIHASQRTAPLHELEFELKSGKLSVMRSLAEKLKEHFGLAWSQQTKLAVGMKLQER